MKKLIRFSAFFLSGSGISQRLFPLVPGTMYTFCHLFLSLRQRKLRPKLAKTAVLENRIRATRNTDSTNFIHVDPSTRVSKILPVVPSLRQN